MEKIKEEEAALIEINDRISVLEREQEHHEDALRMYVNLYQQYGIKD